MLGSCKYMLYIRPVLKKQVRQARGDVCGTLV